MKIKDCVAFVTGANRGLGLALVQELLAKGAKKVYAGVRNPSGIAMPGVVPVRMDVTDTASIAAATAQCGDVTLLINNAGIARVMESALDPLMIEVAREIFETNYYGLVRSTQAFAPILGRNGGGAVINVLSDVTWFARPMLAAYAATKSAAWSFTNAVRVELRASHTQVLGLHVGFIDTDMTKGLNLQKTSPSDVAIRTLVGLEAGLEEVLADDATRRIKLSLSTDKAYYLDPPAVD